MPTVDRTANVSAAVGAINTNLASNGISPNHPYYDPIKQDYQSALRHLYRTVDRFFGLDPAHGGATANTRAALNGLDNSTLDKIINLCAVDAADAAQLRADLAGNRSAAIANLSSKLADTLRDPEKLRVVAAVLLTDSSVSSLIKRDLVSFLNQILNALSALNRAVTSWGIGTSSSSGGGGSPIMEALQRDSPEPWRSWSEKEKLRRFESSPGDPQHLVGLTRAREKSRLRNQIEQTIESIGRWAVRGWNLEVQISLLPAGRLAEHSQLKTDLFAANRSRRGEETSLERLKGRLEDLYRSAAC